MMTPADQGIAAAKADAARMRARDALKATVARKATRMAKTRSLGQLQARRAEITSQPLAEITEKDYTDLLAIIKAEARIRDANGMPAPDSGYPYTRKRMGGFGVIEKIQYRGFEIAVKAHGPVRGRVYTATNNSGEPYTDLPAFDDKARAIAWDKKNIDAYLDGPDAAPVAKPKNAWCRCKPEPEPQDWIYYRNDACSCGASQHHYHCPTCGGITQVG